MKINETVKTGIVKYNGRTYDIYQKVMLNDEGKLFIQSNLMPRGEKERKHSKKLLAILESIRAKAMESRKLFAAVQDTNPGEQTMLLLTSSLNESLHSMLLDYVGEVESYNGKQAKLANPYIYNFKDEELEVFSEI